MSKAAIATFVCRGQPIHNGHFSIINKALESAEYLIIILGSHRRPQRPTDNPFTSAQRTAMIMESLDDAKRARVRFAYVGDRLYNNQLWLTSVNRQVNEIIDNLGFDDDVLYKTNPILHFAFDKDHDSYWVKQFPRWKLQLVNAYMDPEVDRVLCSTAIREFLFCETVEWDFIGARVPTGVLNWLKRWQAVATDPNVSEECRTGKGSWRLQTGEMEFVRNYKKSWKAAPYPVKHVTVDSVVIQSGHVLLVRRRSFPGKGMWALPGGHLEEYENLDMFAAIRELREETGLKVPAPILQGSHKQERVFGHPRRSSIGRVITHAYLFELNPTEDGQLPKVKGADDADKAWWAPLDSLKEEDLYDDHYQIIYTFLGLI